ncbi:MAG: hypothetical protein E7466_05865 [Ruminococcaceae bacterium]|nr:hypothetical protein [Oscillospiraceae bacterium]
MKTMKALIAFVLCFAMLFAFAACGSSDEQSKDDAAKEGTEEKNEGGNSGKVEADPYDYNVGEFTVQIPSGWKEIPVTAIDGSGTDTNSIDICKGTSLFTDPYIRVDYYGPSITMMKLSPSLYENVEELETMEMGGYTWNGFKCTAGDIPLINLQTEAGEHEFQIAIWCETDNGSISLEDADVKAIIESLIPNA